MTFRVVNPQPRLRDMKEQHEHIMIKEVSDALIEAGASDEKASATAVLGWARTGSADEYRYV